MTLTSTPRHAHRGAGGGAGGRGGGGRHCLGGGGRQAMTAVRFMVRVLISRLSYIAVRSRSDMLIANAVTDGGVTWNEFLNTEP